MRSECIVSGMVTKKASRRFYLREHREDKGLSPQQVGDKMGIERESVYRLERKAAEGEIRGATLFDYAQAIGIDWRDLFYPVGTPPSLDGQIEPLPKELKERAADYIRGLIDGRSRQRE